MKHFNFKKIASIASSALMISSTVALAAAANYPAPFVQDGKANVAIVVGSSAAATDTVAATDIAANLATALASQDDGTSDDDDTSVEGGDFVAIEKTNDRLNLGNSMSGVFGNTVDDDDLEVLLADGTYQNDENTDYDYDQQLTLQNLNLTFFTDSDFDDKEPTVGFTIPSGIAILNYSLDFSTDAESDVSSGDLIDLETTDITMFGKTYYILDATNGTNANYFGEFTLLDTANTQTVQEGETKTVTIGENQFEVSISFLDADEVVLIVNGEETNSLNEGSTYKLDDDTHIGIKDIRYDSADNGISSVQFSIGTGKLVIDNGAEVELNDEAVEGVRGWIVRGGISGTKQSVDKIIIQWVTDDEVFIAPGSELVMPGFEAVKFSMSDFVQPMEEVTEVTYAAEDEIELRVPILSGDAAIPLLFAAATGNFTGIGADTDERLATSITTTLVYNETISNTNYHQYFVATYNTSSDAQSYLLSASIDEHDSKNYTTITDEVTNEVVCEKEAGKVCDIGDVSFTITAAWDDDSRKSAIFTAGTNVNFNTVFTEEGLKIYLPFESTNVSTVKGAINFSAESIENTGHNWNSFYVFFDEENKDDDKGAGTSFNLTLNNDADGDVHVSDIDAGGSELEVVGDDDDTISRVNSDLATQVEEIISSDRGTAKITYSGEQSYAKVFLTSMDASVGGNGGSSELGDVVVTDAEASSVSTKNLIVVGGSCINTVAATLLGSSSALCGADFTTKTNVASGQFLIESFDSPFSNGKVAVLVAGYNADDTSNAAKFFTTQTVDTTMGKKYIGSTATQATLQTE